MFRLLLTYHRSKDDPINHSNFIDALMMTKIEIEYNDDSKELVDADKFIFDFFNEYKYFKSIDDLGDLDDEDVIYNPKGYYFVKKSALKFKIKNRIKNVVYLLKKWVTF